MKCKLYYIDLKYLYMLFGFFFIFFLKIEWYLSFIVYIILYMFLNV